MNYSQDVTQVNDVENQDLRLAPKYRKNSDLWQYYLWWSELVELRKRHLLRISSIERGKSLMSGNLEKGCLDKLQLDAHIKPGNKEEKGYSIFSDMVREGEKVGAIWQWLLAHKGLGESLAAQILALIDDVEQFDSIAKLWRYAGYGLYEYWIDSNGKVICPKEGWKWVKINDGMYRVWTVVSNHYADATQMQNVLPESYRYAKPQNIELPLIERVDYLEPESDWHIELLSDRNCEKYHSPYNKKLKAALWNLMESFVKQQTPKYVDLYYSEKKRLRDKFPEKVKAGNKYNYTDGHIDNMAKRKVKKEFLKNLWLKWREFEGLPVSEEYSG